MEMMTLHQMALFCDRHKVVLECNKIRLSLPGSFLGRTPCGQLYSADFNKSYNRNVLAEAINDPCEKSEAEIISASLFS
ncbi:MAG: hypothetical protein WKF97_12020 [Chitinophagaceae bacterium]